MGSIRYLCLALAIASRVALAASFQDDVDFLHRHTDVVVLKADKEPGEIAIVPAWQGRVMTSSVGDEPDLSFGWVNRELISSDKVLPNFNAYGGEERLWLGPEGSQYSIYFPPGKTFDGSNWQVPEALDRQPFRTVSRGKDRVLLRATFALRNYIGTSFRVTIDREVHLLDTQSARNRLGLTPASHLSLVAYESTNTLINSGKAPWSKDTGLLSIWMLSMLNATPSTTVVVPIRPGPEPDFGAPMTRYPVYGVISPERLRVTDKAIFLRGDAQSRGKIGVTPKRSMGTIGSYDPAAHVLTLVRFDQPPDLANYVNSSWGIQENPYAGDAINSYNDGPPAPGAKSFGPFYELETSSPAAALKPGERLRHTRITYHLTGPADELDGVARAALGTSLTEIAAALPSAEHHDAVVGKVPSPGQKTVLVTGASSGIGRKITERLAAGGYFVYAGARKDSEIQALNALDQVRGLHLDITDEGDIAAAADAVAKEAGGLYALVNNAGVLTMGSVVDTSPREFDLVMNVNARAPYRLAQAFAPQITAHHGRIVNIGSTSGIVAWAGGSAYTMSKHAMEAFTDALAEEMEPQGVHVSIIEPGNYKSNIGRAAVQRAGLDSRLEDRSQYKEPDEVADAVALALADRAPKRRYLVTPNEAEAEWTIRGQMKRLVELNEGQKYTFDRKALIKMLDEDLVHARPRIQ
jgi:NAD(P)-dependent dehydrogenase (short-subunit alcohol dehydrogenase family)